jgi:hypothetical protein
MLTRRGPKRNFSARPMRSSMLRFDALFHDDFEFGPHDHQIAWKRARRLNSRLGHKTFSSNLFDTARLEVLCDGLILPRRTRPI